MFKIKIITTAVISIGLSSFCLTANAGFLDSVYDLSRTAGTIGHAANNISYGKRNVEALTDEVGLTGKQETFTSTNIVEGSVLVGKLNTTQLYSDSNKSSATITSLGKDDIMIYMGQEKNGFYYVQSDKGEGWVTKPLVALQY